MAYKDIRVFDWPIISFVQERQQGRIGQRTCLDVDRRFVASIEVFHGGEVRFGNRAVQTQTKGLRQRGIDSAKSSVTASHGKKHLAAEGIEASPRAGELDARKRISRLEAPGKFKISKLHFVSSSEFRVRVQSSGFSLLSPEN